jgi:hypothetical protein
MVKTWRLLPSKLRPWSAAWSGGQTTGLYGAFTVSA